MFCLNYRIIMKEIIQYLFDASDKQDCYYNHPAVYISIGLFQISISFDSEAEFDDSFSHFEDIESFKIFKEKHSVIEFKIYNILRKDPFRLQMQHFN
jgi:hypothetical protein